jgi:hypothetical protein
MRIRLLSVSLLFLCNLSFAAEKLTVAKMSGAITFDGICSSEEWDQLEAIPLQMFRPNHAQSPSERSDIYVSYDQAYFYVASRFYYENGAKISSVTKKRDSFDEGNDMLGILFDSFNDNENGMGFVTAPSGLRMDFNVFNDAQGSTRRMPFSGNWNTYWDVKTNIIDEVWHVEMRIPISSLRFEDKDGQVTMGMMVWRYIASKVEYQSYPLMPNNLGPFSMYKPSKSQKISFEELKSKKPVYLTPYVLTGIEQINELNENETAYESNLDKKLNFGFDLKYGLSSNLTMDLTVNTDFAHVEVDDEQINLTRFPLFFPEKRQFFLERSSTFRFNSGGPNTLFYSRRIGLYEGEIVPIYGGIRLVGRKGKWDYGFLDMQTAEIDEVVSTNHGVFRLRKQVINENSYIGGIVTNKIGTDGQYNTSYGIDGNFRLFGNDYLTINYAQTFGDSLSNDAISMKNAKFYTTWEKRSDEGFGYSLSLAKTGEDYNPEMGYEYREDYSRARVRLWYGWINNENSPLFKHSIRLGGYAYKRNSDFETETIQIDPSWEFQTKSGFMGSIGYTFQYENVPELFEITDDVYIPEGIYEFNGFEGMLSTPANKLFSLQGMTYVGSYYDGFRIMVSPEILLKPSSSFQISLDYIFNYLDIPNRDQLLNAHIARLKTEIMISTKLSGSFFLQYNGVDHVGVDNIRIRYNPREGNDLWLVYNDVMNTNRKRDLPNLPQTDSRTFIIKYNHTFRWAK